MFIKKKTRPPEITELSVHDGVPPRMVLTSEFDLDARTAAAEDQARIDAASGAYDRIAIEALTTLPYERQIDDEIVMLQRSAALPTGYRLRPPLTSSPPARWERPSPGAYASSSCSTASGRSGVSSPGC